MDARAHAHLDFAVRSREAPDAAGPPPRRRWTPSPFPAPPSPPPVRPHARGSAGRRRSATGNGWSGAANREQAPHGERAHPTEEHYLPLLVAIGASDAHEPGQLIRGGLKYGGLSMDSCGFGLPADAPAGRSEERRVGKGGVSAGRYRDGA